MALLFSRQRQRWVVLAAIPLWFALYALNPLFLLHYGLPLAATVAIAIATVTRQSVNQFHGRPADAL